MMRYLTIALLLVLQITSGQVFDPRPPNPDPIPGSWSADRRPQQREAPFTAHPAAPGPATPDRAKQPAQRPANVPHDKTRVAVLGYHNFSETKPVTEMLMRTSEFRGQMEYIRRAGLTVISMQEFLEWRFGARELPAECVLITLDDGWRSVYTDAYPILKEYGYPFTLFLYSKYLSGRGDSMNPAMIREMQANGATIGSHSTSHLYPKVWKAEQAKGEEAYTSLIDNEIGKSQQHLSSLFGNVKTYCYPGGYITQPMVDRLPSYGYVAAFTVIPAKVTSTEDPWRIHRYMIFGNDPGIFNSAMDFRVAQEGKVVSTGTTPGTLPKSTPPPPFPVSPQPNAQVSCDVPTITAQLSGVAGVDFSTLRMSVSGFGRVPAQVDATARTISWTPPYRIYMPNLSVHITWNSSDGTSHKAEWTFTIDQNVSVEP